MKTVVLGSAGQLGRDLISLLPGVVIPATRADADLTSPAMLQSLLEQHRPTHVINCAAYNFVDRAETEPETAFAINAWGVRNLARICAAIDATFVHFSTDYVFGLDLARREPWMETDAPGPVSAYGLSKLTGEFMARKLCTKHHIIRSCGLYGVWGSGGKGGNFVENMLRLAGQGTLLRVVDDQRCTPSFTVDVALATAKLIAAAQYGIHHVTNAGDCTWFEFAREIFRQMGLQPDLNPITSEQFGAPARRPSYSVLNCRELVCLRPWQDALAAYLKLRTKK